MKLTYSAAAAVLTLVSAAPTAPKVPAKIEVRDINININITTPASGNSTDAPLGIKKGLAYNNGAITDLFSQEGSATWAYNWGTAQQAPKFQQIPMFWGPGSLGDANGIWAKINAGDTPWVLGYNEPDVSRDHGGCASTPQQTYEAWGRDMLGFRDRGVKLVCPAISSWDTEHGHTGGPSGLTWLRQFTSIGNNPSYFQCGAQALHWYGEAGRDGRDQARLFIEYVERAHTAIDEMFRCEMPLWITEFAPLPLQNPQVMADFLDVAIPWLDRTPYVARYSPFMAEHMVTGSSLNVAGQMFVSKRG